jgi:hypothetical protein
VTAAVPMATRDMARKELGRAQSKVRTSEGKVEGATGNWWQRGINTIGMNADADEARMHLRDAESKAESIKGYIEALEAALKESVPGVEKAANETAPDAPALEKALDAAGKDSSALTDSAAKDIDGRRRMCPCRTLRRRSGKRRQAPTWLDGCCLAPNVNYKHDRQNSDGSDQRLCVLHCRFSYVLAREPGYSLSLRLLLVLRTDLLCCGVVQLNPSGT